MSRLPNPGGDSGQWGEILNDFLSVEHNPDGTLKDSGSLADKANVNHTHIQSEITDLVDDLAGKQPASSDLSAIAALSTTTFGRSLLTAADAADAKSMLNISAPDSPETVRVPQLRGVPITVYGHSQSVPNAGYHGSGNHWSQLLPGVSSSGALTNYGVGGTTMEYAAQVIDSMPGAAFPGRWGYPAAKTMALIMDVYNSVAAEVTNGRDQAASIKSFKGAARFIAAVVNGNRIAPTDASLVQSGPGWAEIASPGEPLSSTGGLRYSFSNGATLTWTAAANYDQAWLPVLWYNFDYSSDVTAIWNQTKNGSPFPGNVTHQGRFKAPSVNGTASEPYDYMWTAIPLGSVAAGDVFQWQKVSGWSIGNGGIITLGDKHHACFVKENSGIQPVGFPYASWYPSSRIQAYNTALDEIKQEFDAIRLNLVSLLDLDQFSDLDPSTMLWSGDRLHFNQKGNQWELGHLSQELRGRLPWTSRLHTL